MKRVLLTLVCALLLFAQQSALTHAVGHTSEQFPAHHEHHADDAAHPGHDDTAEYKALCAFDVTFSQVLGGAAGASRFFAEPPPVAETTLPRFYACHYTVFLAPLSRGPPVLL